MEAFLASGLVFSLAGFRPLGMRVGGLPRKDAAGSGSIYGCKLSGY